jgi:hypothetical protein
MRSAEGFLAGAQGVFLGGNGGDQAKGAQPAGFAGQGVGKEAGGFKAIEKEVEPMLAVAGSSRGGVRRGGQQDGDLAAFRRVDLAVEIGTQTLADLGEGRGR